MHLHIGTTWNLCIFLSLFYMIVKTAICTYLCISNSLGSLEVKPMADIGCFSSYLYVYTGIYKYECFYFQSFKIKRPNIFLNETGLAFQLSGKK